MPSGMTWWPAFVEANSQKSDSAKTPGRRLVFRRLGDKYDRYPASGMERFLTPLATVRNRVGNGDKGQQRYTSGTALSFAYVCQRFLLFIKLML